jgi:CheY-like chemotaxis protein/two-component sensor histidine kinase
LDEHDPVRPYLQEMTRAGERATALTQRLLAFGSRQTLRPEVLEVDAVVRELATLLSRLIGDEIQLAVDPGSRAAVRADRSQLEQVLMNLAINARDAMPDGGRLTIATRADEGHVRLTVSDTGVGMDAETQLHVFEPFFTTKPEGKGTGLGLSTVFGIVRQSEGEIAVESIVGAGSTFTVTLPRCAERPEETGADEAAPLPSPGSERILVVEDEAGVRGLVRRVLEQGGYAVDDAAGPEEALQFATAPYDLLITDLLMPVMSGRDLAERVRDAFPGTRVLYISGYTGDTMMDRGLLKPGERFLAKPFSPLTLVEEVRAILDGG